jgi:hypothetical protein
VAPAGRTAVWAMSPARRTSLCCAPRMLSLCSRGGGRHILLTCLSISPFHRVSCEGGAGLHCLTAGAGAGNNVQAYAGGLSVSGLTILNLPGT